MQQAELRWFGADFFFYNLAISKALKWHLWRKEDFHCKLFVDAMPRNAQIRVHYMPLDNKVGMFEPVFFELPNDKTNKMTCVPSKESDSQGIRPDWSESSLCAHWVAQDPSFLHADSEDSDQTGRMAFCWFGRVAANLVWSHTHLWYFSRMIN